MEKLNKFLVGASSFAFSLWLLAITISNPVAVGAISWKLSIAFLLLAIILRIIVGE